MMELFWLEHKKLWRRAGTKVSVLVCFLYLVGFGGILSMQQIIRDYQRMESVDAKRAWDLTDWVIINGWLGDLWPELHETGSYQVDISYFDPEKLTDFYGRRQQVLEKYLENNNQTGAEKAYLLQIDEKVIKPFHYGWIRGWQTVLSFMIDTSAESMALFLAIVLSALFAGEWHDNTSSFVLTTKNGWRTVALAKVLTGLAFTLLGMIGFAGIVMLISSAVKSNVLALILSLAVVYVPTAVDPYLPFGLQKALGFIPLVGSGTDIFRTYTFHIFGNYVWSPYLLITVPVLIGVGCMPFAVRKWSRRVKV